MAFVDEITIQVKAGRGGDGVVRWRHEKGKALAGAAGGNGGAGGNVYLIAVSDLGVLSSYRQIKEFTAEDGSPGENWSKHGKDGKSIEIKVPVGSVVRNKENNDIFHLDKVDEKICVAKGGRGGLGNEHFKASTNTTPKESTPGKSGEEYELYIELELVADIGLVGLPNAGKSSLLNALTKSKAKVGNYKFTTLEPNLGALYDIIIADIPGLIEGASEGKGLGHRFLRHVRRTKMLAHCISLEEDDPRGVYEIVQKELKAYNSELLEKPEIIIFTKTDTVDEEKIKKAKAVFKDKKVFLVSVYDLDSLKSLSESLVKMSRHSK